MVAAAAQTSRVRHDPGFRPIAALEIGHAHFTDAVTHLLKIVKRNRWAFSGVGVIKCVRANSGRRNDADLDLRDHGQSEGFGSVAADAVSRS